MSDDAASAPEAPSPPPPAPEPAQVGAPPIARWVSLGAAALGLLLLVALYWRGTSTHPTPLAPTDAAQGVQRQLFAAPDGPRVQAAVVLERPLDDVWQVVTDYPHFGEIFSPPLWTLEVERADWTDERRCHLTGQARSRLWAVPIDVTIDHERAADGSRTASWDDSSGDRVNRGRWLLRPLGPERTRVVYEAQVRVGSYPAFLIDDLLLTEVGYVLTGVRDRLAR